MRSPRWHIILRGSRPAINEQRAFRAVLAQQQAARASNTVSNPEAHATCHPCCSCSFMSGLTCVSVASGLLSGSLSEKARQLTDLACKCGHLTSQEHIWQRGSGASTCQLRHAADLSASKSGLVLLWSSRLQHQGHH